MKPSNDILTELQSLSPLIAGLQKTTIFSVPEGYFDTLENTILLCLNEKAPVSSIPKTADIPAGYFDNLSATILDKIKAQQNVAATIEETPSTLLKSVQNKNVFEVPDEYFDSLADSVTVKIRLAENTLSEESSEIPSLLSNIKNLNVFDVPQGYFENLAKGVVNKINENQYTAAEELKELSPLLLSIQKKTVFEVPMGYFNGVAANVLTAVVIPSQGKIVTIGKSRSLFRYAAAAFITGAMALGVYKYVQQPVNPKVFVGTQVAALAPAIEKGMKMNDQQLNAGLDSLTKEDIARYLEKNGSDVDMSLLSSSPEEIDLPSQDDYLLDGKTLENYLNKINFQN
jgi:hypothetical protein